MEGYGIRSTVQNTRTGVVPPSLLVATPLGCSGTVMSLFYRNLTRGPLSQCRAICQETASAGKWDKRRISHYLNINKSSGVKTSI